MDWVNLLPYVVLVLVVVGIAVRAAKRPTPRMELERKLVHARVPMCTWTWTVPVIASATFIGIACSYYGQRFLGELLRFIAAGGAMYVYFGLRKARLARFCATLRDRNYRVCNNCLFDLGGSAKCGKCPECAKDYTLPALQAYWSDLIREAER